MENLKLESLKKKRAFVKARTDLHLFRLDLRINSIILNEEYRRTRKELEESRKKNKLFVKGEGGYFAEEERKSKITKELVNLENKNKQDKKNISEAEKEGRRENP